MIIADNISALQTANELNQTTQAMQTSLTRLSTGLRINSAADDAAGLAITSTMGNVIDGLNQANINVQNGINLIQTADGAGMQVNSILDRMQTLANEAANGTLTTSDRSDIQKEINQLISDINQIGSSTNFNGIKLFTGGFAAKGVLIQYGAYSSDTYAVTIGTMSAASLGFNGLSVSSLANAGAAITKIQQAVSSMATMGAALGAYQNGLQYLSNNLQTSLQNLTASQATIQDTDVATEMATFTRLQILQQSGTAMLAQANALPQAALKLLG